MIGGSEFLAYTGPDPVEYPVHGMSQRTRVLDVGAGAGSGTLHLLEHLPQSHIVCLEPDAAARNALLWRLIDHPHRERVSVLPIRLEDAAALGPFDLVASNHVICQVPVADRPAFWQGLHAVLAPDGIAVFDSHLGRAAATAVPRQMTASGPNGAYTVSRWFTSTIDDTTGDQHVRNEYVITDTTGQVVYREDHQHTVELVDHDHAHAQITDAGLAHEPAPPGWMILTRTH